MTFTTFDPSANVNALFPVVVPVKVRSPTWLNAAVEIVEVAAPELVKMTLPVPVHPPVNVKLPPLPSSVTSVCRVIGELTEGLAALRLIVFKPDDPLLTVIGFDALVTTLSVAALLPDVSPR